MSSAEARPIRVLVVDDSALVREVLPRVLRSDPSFSVATAADPLIASRKIVAERPDVIVLDLAMPRMDGLSFLRQLMATDPIPVVVCSVLTDGAADVAMRALDEGAVDVVAKPRLGRPGVHDDAVLPLVDALRAAAQARIRRRAVPLAAAPSAARPHGSLAEAPTQPLLRPLASDTLVAIGASTGGTEALGLVLGSMPEGAPGLVIVQHMPEGFTAAFARRLDGVCRISVKEAADGDTVARGRALIAPGNRHIVVRAEGSQWRVRVVDGPPVSRHRPSVDVLFGSVAEAAGSSAIGVLMTGMGRDGAEGLRTMKERGARTIAQDAATSVVFGMPKEAIALGAVDEVLPLSRIGAAILDKRSALRRAEG